MAIGVVIANARGHSCSLSPACHYSTGNHNFTAALLYSSPETKLWGLQVPVDCAGPHPIQNCRIRVLCMFSICSSSGFNPIVQEVQLCAMEYLICFP